MKILPPVTSPPRQPTARRHSPRITRGAQGYQAYRACLRWDFGFTCAFCLSHEADLAGGRPIEGLGVTGVEHGIPQGADRNRINDYSNCLYSCRYCNGARASRPRSSEGRSLLDPTMTAWGDHFLRSGDQLLPREGDLDAVYTHEVYDMDDPRKVDLRRMRRELIADRLELLQRFPDDLEWLLSEAEASPPSRARQALDLARRLRRGANLAREELKGFAVVPADAPKVCRCNGTEHHTLPPQWANQSLEWTENG
jgi:hypothetical protein